MIGFTHLVKSGKLKKFGPADLDGFTHLVITCSMAARLGELQWNVFTQAVDIRGSRVIYIAIDDTPQMCGKFVSNIFQLVDIPDSFVGFIVVQISPESLVTPARFFKRIVADSDGSWTAERLFNEIEYAKQVDLRLLSVKGITMANLVRLVLENFNAIVDFIGGISRRGDA